MWKVQLFELNYDHREEEAVQEVLRSRWITMGEKTIEFERLFCEELGINSGSLAVSSATAALHMALMALDIGPGDEVVVPSLTFVSDLNVISRVGARPVLVDCISFDDWTLEPGEVEAAITDRTRAVMVVHYGGYACDMDRILEISRRYGLAVIEDAAHSPGATFADQPLGTIGDIGCFSFFTNKNLSVGEGGMYVTTDSKLLERGRLLRSQGMSTMTLDRHKGRSAKYDVIEPGLNYRIDEMRAALGIVQLEKLSAGNARREELTGYYRERLDATDGISIPFQYWDRGRSSYHIFPTLLDERISRNEVIASLARDGVQASIHYPAPQDFSAYRRLSLQETPRSREISENSITLPLFPGMSDSQLEYVCCVLERALAEQR